MKHLSDKELKELLEYYDIESLEEFEPRFNMSCVDNWRVEDLAIENLKSRFTQEELIQVKNYTECGVVEFVADDDFYIDETNRIITPMNDPEEYERLEQEDFKLRGFEPDED